MQFRFFPLSILLTANALTACATNPPAETPVESGSNVATTAATEPAPPSADPAPRALASEASPDAKAAIHAAIAADDREADDRALDEQRKPEEMLNFFGVTPGMRVAELAAGRGYTTELLARAVGPSGKVYGQNSKFILERFAGGPWSERLKKPALQNVERIDTEFEAPFPASVKDLDRVFIVLFYHDTVWFGTDRAAMNRAVFAALKPGGVYAIVDHSARAGDGTDVAKSLHRIEESVVQAEVLAAGFTLAKSADFLREPSDARDWNASPSAAGDKRGHSDRFVLEFVKPL